MVKDIRISALRMIATIMIVVLHIFQELEKSIANINFITDWLNLGLVMFCCISAFLYSSRNVDNVKVWYRHRYFEIVLPAIIVGISTALVFLMAGELTMHNVYAAVFASLGFEAFLDDSWMFIQLWFLTYLLIFYLTVPLVQKINCKCKSEMKFWVILIASIVFMQGVLFVIESVANIELLSFGIFLRFYLPYFVFKRYSIDNVSLKKIMKLFTLLCVPVVLLTCYVRYVAEITVIGEIIFIYAQTFAGFVLFYWLYQAFFKLNNYNKILRLSDKYSYAIYLTHCLFIGYKTSVIRATSNLVAGIIFALLLTMISSVALIYVTSMVKKICINNRKMSV